MSKSSARQARRRFLFEEQSGVCCYCTGQMQLTTHNLGYQPSDMITLEHVVQKADGGTYDLKNCKGACKSCNVSRPNGMSSADYHALRLELLDQWAPCTEPCRNVLKKLRRASPQSIFQMVTACP